MSARTSLNFPSEFTQAPINTSAAGLSTLIAAAAGKRIKVFRMKLIVAAATTIEFLDGSTILDILAFPTQGTMVLDFTTIDMPAWYQTSPGNALVLSNSGGVQLTGNMDYIQS